MTQRIKILSIMLSLSSAAPSKRWPLAVEVEFLPGISTKRRTTFTSIESSNDRSVTSSSSIEMAWALAAGMDQRRSGEAGRTDPGCRRRDSHPACLAARELREARLFKKKGNHLVKIHSRRCRSLPQPTRACQRSARQPQGQDALPPVVLQLWNRRQLGAIFV